ncbi:MAG TPA: hypothetical protein DDW76_00390 [Cyanobacteria bacterium UBA11369]|nr:hypothetical protein [Cyanobacteria bacterium UBA11371]HBE18862.1 hypothetical protein [Cyanobacteria bacterium UBA11367]HBE34365.1 hypothetical protein [Cyanobacteria bacterium UBA11368]HBE47297.1 hypothetical protein [Cyanobacteria bacterium UBA11369]
MFKLSSDLSKFSLGIVGSFFYIPFLSSSVYAFSLGDVFDKGSTASQIFRPFKNTTLTCNRKVDFINGFVPREERTLTCDMTVDALAPIVGWSTAGQWQWQDIWINETFWGKASHDYNIRIDTNATGVVQVGGVNGAGTAKIAVHDLYKPRSKVQSVSWDSHLWSRTPAKYLNFNSISLNKNISLTRNKRSYDFTLGAYLAAYAESIAAGWSHSTGTISFTSRVTIHEKGRSRSSLGSFASVASVSNDDFISVSDDELTSVSTNDFSNVFGDEPTSVLDDDFSNISDDEFSIVSENDFSNISDDGIATSVPEPSQIGGLAALLTMLLATKRSRFTKKHPKETEKLVGQTKVTPIQSP